MKKIDQKSHYQKLKKYLPRGYRKTIFESTGASESLIDHVLRGLREDNKGILTEAYRLAVEEQKKKNSNSIKLDLLQKELNSKA